jgi:DNA repair ATPase RecN
VIRQIEELQREGVDPSSDRRLESLESQLASSDHLGDVLADAERRLKILDTRLEDSVTRAIDVSARLGDDRSLSTVEEDMTLLVDELEALREALDDTEGPALGTG